ncbi:MAG: hypothetical protein LJF15_04110 [Acidobacteria bacterium]|nr:hypothetical protein [Acidobacteriota bacterium]
MRGVLVAAVVAVGLLLASFASAQGLGDVATQEKEKRKAAPKTESKVYTENDLGPSVAPVGVPSSLPTDSEASADEGEEGDGEDAEAAAAADEQRAQAEAAWRKKLERAQKEQEVYQDVIDRLQQELNDISGGVNTPARAAKIAFLEENKQLLAEARERVATLEAEGRANGYH